MMGDLLNPGASAEKNNQNQQAAAVNNAEQAWQTGAKNFNTWQASNPNPLANATIAKPQGTSPVTQQILQTPQVNGAPQISGVQPQRKVQGSPQVMPQPAKPAPVNPSVVNAILSAQ
jgi:hypothetical protein